MAEHLKLRDVSVHYGAFTAAHNVSLSLQAGEIGCLLGPSGCGKTTLLRAIGGFEPLSAGEISLQGNTISGVGNTLPPEQRQVGMVFQDFALFPHLDVGRNVAFGLSYMNRSQRAARVSDMLELVGLGQSGRAYPHELSGGQQQRVALARALAPKPRIVLLDEPFSGLDSELREQLAGEVRQLLQRNQMTALLVTHDQHEAFAMADQITLINGGTVVQSGTPDDLYHRPIDAFTAGFIGEGAVIAVQVNGDGTLDFGLGLLQAPGAAQYAGRSAGLLLRPTDIAYAAHSSVSLPVAARAFRGAQYLYQLQLPDGQLILCLAPVNTNVSVGESLPVSCHLDALSLFEPS